jgi:enamine deaminase RidA (YjgF/YER057c/UK114 family)
LGDLDRIEGWVKALGMVNCTPDFDRQPQVINGFSHLILDVFGPEVGRHARSAVGMNALPMRIAVEIEAEVLVRP